MLAAHRPAPPTTPQAARSRVSLCRTPPKTPPADQATVEAQDHMTIRLLVAMADGFRKLGHEIVVDLPPHAHGIAPTMTKSSVVPPIKENP